MSRQKLHWGFITLSLLTCACSARVFPTGNVFENMQKKDDYSLLYYNDSLDFSVSYWDYTHYIISPSLRKAYHHLPAVYKKIWKEYTVQQPLVMYQYRGENTSRRFIIFAQFLNKADLNSSRDTIYQYLRSKKQVIDLDTSLIDTSFHYEHREIRYTIKYKSASFVDVVEYHTINNNAVCRFVFTLKRTKKDAENLKVQFLYRDANWVMNTYKVKIKDRLLSDYLQNPGLMATNIFINAKYNYLEPLYWLHFFSRNDTSKERQSEIASALNTYHSFVGNFEKSPAAKTDIKSVLIDQENYQKTDAVDAILQVADKQKVIMLNEDHLNPYGRIFAKRLLAGLYQRGYRYLAVETLTYDPLLNSRKYVLKSSGFYISEPSFGDFLRTSLQIGFRLVPYENDKPCDCGDVYCRVNCRERNQAANIAQLFIEDAQAKVFIYTGHNHIYKKSSNDKLKYMAEQFKEMTGITPFCIDQVDFNDHVASSADYPVLLEPSRELKGSFVWKKKGEAEKYWTQTQKTDVVDMQIVHPVTTFEQGYPDWLFDKGNNEIPIKLNKRKYNGSLFQVFYMSEVRDNNEDIVPLINITLKESNNFTISLPNGTYYLKVANRYGFIQYQKEITVLEQNN